MTDKDYKELQKMIQNELKRLGLLTGHWHLGKVESVIDSKHVSVFIDDSSVPQIVGANPDVTFNMGDEIYVVYVNGNKMDKFALCRRAV